LGKGHGWKPAGGATIKERLLTEPNQRKKYLTVSKPNESKERAVASVAKKNEEKRHAPEKKKDELREGKNCVREKEARVRLLLHLRLKKTSDYKRARENRSPEGGTHSSTLKNKSNHR